MTRTEWQEQLQHLRRELKNTIPGSPEDAEIRKRYKALEAQAGTLTLEEPVLLPPLESPVTHFRHIQAGNDYFENVKGNVYTGPVYMNQQGETQSGGVPLEKPANAINPVTLCEAYLNGLCSDTRNISLAGIDIRVASASDENCHHLDQIYTALLTQGAELRKGAHEKLVPNQDLMLEGHSRPLSALAQLNQHQHLVLLGGPGSGKSTFVNFVTMCLAGASLGEEEHYMPLLTAPLPDDKGQDQEDRQPWQQGSLLPIRVILRDFAARGFPAEGEPLRLEHLWQFLRAELHAITPTLGDFTPYLHQYFWERGGILLLDGLDEVPEAERYRTQLKKLVETFARTYRKCRVLVTSRTYAYQKQGWRLDGFQEATLASFSNGQICRFVDLWYPTVAPSYDLTPEQTHTRAEQLKQQILERPALHTLAERPLLLTLMASLHAWRLRDLPKKRVELYKETVDLLLDRWERRKFKTPDEHIPKSLLEWLKTDKDAVLELLSKLAYQAHKTQLDSPGASANIPEKALLHGLLEISDEEVRPRLLSRYLRERTGLLIPHGVGVYTFPHRTFQEYLAACHLVAKPEYPDNIAELARQDPNRWREVLLLAAASAANVGSMIWVLAESLCLEDIAGNESSPQDAWGALLAGQALVETMDVTHIIPRNRPKAERIRDWLTAILTERTPKDSPFPAVERALAGNILAQLGDQRPGVKIRHDGLPDIVWCEVPEGSFLMGSDPKKDPPEKIVEDLLKASNLGGEYKNIFEEGLLAEQPQHEVLLSPYQISRYAVTNVQYQEFIDDGGYTEKWKHCWTEEGRAWKGKENIRGPQKYGGAFDLSNHPVVGVSWYEATAFCNWLTLRLQQAGELEERQKIRLPSEAEWEKAARGEDGRIYPWGDEKITAELTNYVETGLGATSAVGCFSRGKSPYECEDISGNIYEWCLDIYSADAYKQHQHKNPIYMGSGSRRVLRGGGWAYDARLCRSASRNFWRPASRYVDLGFRLVRTPS